MEHNLSFWLTALFICGALVSNSVCTDKLFVAEATNAMILMAEAIDYSFVNTTYVEIPLTGLVFPIGVEFDHRTEMIYWTDAVLHTVNRASLDGLDQEVIVRLENASTDAYYPYAIALNLDDDKVYWADQYRGIIEMANLDGSNRIEIITVGFASYPAAIVYSSFRRKIYWTDRGLYPRIEMANPDGTEREELLNGTEVHYNLTDPTGLSLDALERRLYWTDTTLDRIEHLNLDDMNRFVNLRITVNTTDIHPFGIANYYEDIYFADHNYDGVYAIDFPPGKIHLVNEQLPTPAEIHIYADTSCQLENRCASTGTCVISRRQPDLNAECVCDRGFTGIHCETNIDDCYPQPCMNGAICIDGIQSYNCSCAPGYMGPTCSIEINECDSSPCQNEATCVDNVNSFSCICAPGFTDSDCSTDIDECDPQPCMNGGSCRDGIALFTCDCVPGYFGSTCSTEVNECDSNPCDNGATCLDGVNDFTCLCSPEFTGIYCSSVVDPCLYYQPCGINEDCTNSDIVEDGYTCNCSDGFQRRNRRCLASRSVGGSFGFSRVNGQLASFTDALNDPMSEEYLEMQELCLTILEGVISNIMASESIDWDVVITGFRSGSIVAEFEVIVFSSDRGALTDQAAMVEESLGEQEAGVWVSSDGSVSFNVESLVAFGEICLASPCLNGMCTTSPGDVNYRCVCNYGYTGQHCETELTCSLPIEPLTHVVMPESVYRGDDVITIRCDEKEESVVWRCNGTSGQWVQLAELDCKEDDEEGGLPIGIIIGIVGAAVVVLVVAMIFVFLYKMAGRKRETTTDGVHPNDPHPGPGLQGIQNRAFVPHSACDDSPMYSPAGARDMRYVERTGTLPMVPSQGYPSEVKSDDLPPAYDELRAQASGGLHVDCSIYEEVIHKATWKPEDETPSPAVGNSNVYLRFDANSIEDVTTE